jgi:hypothetical protein
LLVGGMKARSVDQTWWRSALEILTVKGFAAALAWAAGAILQSVARPDAGRAGPRVGQREVHADPGASRVGFLVLGA